MDAELGGVKVKDGVAVDQLPAEGIVAPDFVDLLPGIVCHGGNLGEHLPAPLGQVPAADVQAGHEQVAAGGGLGEVDNLPHIPGVDLLSHQQQAGLGQAAAAFVHGHGGHIRPCLHGRDRHPVPKVEVGAVGLVRQAVHSGLVSHLHNGPQVAAHAVVGGVVHQHRHGVGMLRNGLFHLLPAHTKRDTQPGVYLGVYINRDSAAEHQCVNHASVDVPGENDFIPPLAGGEHHALDRAGGAAHHQKGCGSAEGLRRQLLRLPDNRNGMTQVIQGFHAVHIHRHALLPQKGGQLRVAPAVLVPGHIKGHHPHLPEPLERLVNGGTVLVQISLFFFHITPHQRKNAGCNNTTCEKIP